MIRTNRLHTLQLGRRLIARIYIVTGGFCFYKLNVVSIDFVHSNYCYTYNNCQQYG